MKTNLLIFSLLALITTGCGSDFKEQTFTKGPQNDSELGFVATGLSLEERNEVLTRNPQATARSLVKNFAYEFRGVSKAEILESAPSAQVEKNAFMKTQENAPEQKAADLFELNPDVEFNSQNCVLNRFLITPGISPQNLSSKTNASPKIGNKLKFSAKNAVGEKDLVGWLALSPNGSKTDPKLKLGESFQFTVDMAGNYSALLFFKKNDQCNVSRFDFFVIDNSPYRPEDSEADKQARELLSKQNFYQISGTKIDLAKKLLKGQELTKVVIAIIDTGVNYNHPALKRKMWTNKKEIAGDNLDNDLNGFVDDVVGYDFASGDSFPMDEKGHGSHVAGLAAGEFFGAGSDHVEIMALKAASSAQGIDVGSAVSSIQYAIDHEADIINMSFGLDKPLPTLKVMIERANEAGLLTVAAAGNGDQFGNGMNNDHIPQFPSNYEVPNIISIGATRIDDFLTKYSNFGKTNVDIAALGGFSDQFVGPRGLLSSASITNPNGFLTQPQQGTSMSAPIVSGVAGLILSKSPDLEPAQVIEVLMKSGRKVSALKDLVKSESVVDAEAAILGITN